MLAIRMQRTGRKGHAQFRIIVQESRRSPSSGRVVASLGHYDPHTKTAVLEKEKASTYLTNGAQPSDRVARLLKSEGVKLPDWVKLAAKKKRTIRNAEKLRKNRPAEEAVKTEEPTQADEATAPKEPETAAEVETDAAPEAEAKAEDEKPEVPADAPETAAEDTKQ